MTTRFATPKSSNKSSRSLWQSFIAPMLLASLGLHALLLLMPTGAADEAAIPPPDPEQDSVAITRVPPPSPSAAAPATQPVGGITTASPPATAQALRNQGQGLSGQTQGTTQAPTPNGQRLQNRRRSPSGTSQPDTRTTQTNQEPNPASPPTSADTGQSSNSNQAAVPTPPPAPAEPSRPLFNPEIGERLMAYVAALNLPQAQVDTLRASIQDRFGYDAEATTRDAYSTNLREWENTIQQQTGQANLSVEEDRTDLSVTYPQRVCLVNEPGEVRVGVLVNPDGSQRGEPVLLRSSGYGALDQRALAVVSDHQFPTAESLKAYTIAVEPQVDYGRRPCLNANPEQPSARKSQ